MNKIVLGLAGKAEHGKSAASRIIQEHVHFEGGICEIFELSTYIYRSCVTKGLLPAGLDRSKMTHEQIKILVDEGNAGRAENIMKWTNLTVQAMAESKADVVICPNVRFQTEVDGVHSIGGVNIRINRLNENGTPYISLSRNPNDVTETAADYLAYDYYLINITGKNQWYERQVRALFDHIADRVQFDADLDLLSRGLFK